MKRALIMVLGLMLCVCLAAVDNAIQAEIGQILQLQQEAWNRGDLEGFLGFYWHSAELTFQGGSKRFYGWDALLAQYQRSYGQGKQGALAFSEVKVARLSSASAYVIGRWQLTFPDSKKDGMFTIIFRHFPEGWRIVHDHSS